MKGLIILIIILLAYAEYDLNHEPMQEICYNLYDDKRVDCE